ncbi:LOW QUALITY PROTEIN: hypothetical protein BRARA_A02499 [Brassica rapa]|uniref:DUF1985 domain-containing protein n=1 Tax=Brassica campestris TaxID=3711 RepID=A0A398AVX9_BRACM|nr:LOW QUALITY PROTEIN: hypothetical protein BRARA_A02499 [Brassica rapa]
MDVSEDLARDYPPRLYHEGASIFENKSINTNSHFSEIPRLRQAIGIHVWDNLKTYPVGLIAKLAESKLVWSDRTLSTCRQLRVYKKEIWSLVVDQPLRFSLIEFGEITGLNTNPLPEESFEPDPENYKAFADQRKWYRLLFLIAIGLYGLHHNCRIPFESAKRVFDDDALMTYPWGRTAYEFLVDSIKLLHPQGGSYTLSGFKDVLLVWAYESVTVFGELYGRKVNPDEIPLLQWGGSRTRASLATTIAKEMNDHGTVRVRKMVMKEGLEELFPQWKDEADDLQLDNLIKDIHADRTKKTKAGVSSEAEPPSKKQKKGKKQNEVKINEGETAVVEEKESAKEKGRSEAVLLNIVAHLEKLDHKFDSRLTEYDTKFGDFSQEDNQQPESNSGQPDGQNVMVSEDNRQPDSNSGQPASKTPIDKQFEDNQPQKTPDKGQSEKNLKQEEAELKRKKKQEEAELKKKQKKEEAELKKKKKQEEADLKKKKKQEEADSKKDIPASKRTRSGTIRIPIPTKQIKNTKYSDELWPESDVEEDERKRCGRIKEYRLKAVQLSPDGSQMSAEFGPSVPFPHIGDNVMTCMRKGFEPSPTIYDSLGPVDPVKKDNLLQHRKPHEKIPHGKAHEDIEFYRILITPRPWPIKEYGWLVQNPPCLNYAAVTLDIAQPNLKPYPKIGKYLISQPIRLHKTAV